MYSTLLFAGIICLTLAFVCLVATIGLYFGGHVRDARAFLSGKTSEQAVAEFRNQTTTRRRAAVLDAEVPEWNAVPTINDNKSGARVEKTDADEAPTTQVGDAQKAHQDHDASVGDAPTTWETVDAPTSTSLKKGEE